MDEAFAGFSEYAMTLLAMRLLPRAVYSYADAGELLRQLREGGGAMLCDAARGIYAKEGRDFPYALGDFGIEEADEGWAGLIQFRFPVPREGAAGAIRSYLAFTRDGSDAMLPKYLVTKRTVEGRAVIAFIDGALREYTGEDVTGCLGDAERERHEVMFDYMEAILPELLQGREQRRAGAQTGGKRAARRRGAMGKA